MSYQVVEKFVSINGEGQKSGELAIFIRLAGCNLACSYCDTKWANESDVAYTEMSKETILQYIREMRVNNITLTGGEPLLNSSVKELIEILTKDPSLFLEIETNGSVDIKPFIVDERSNLSFTVDYKSASSRMEDRMHIENFKHLRINDTMKFVVGDMKDLKKAHSIINEFELDKKCKVFISPVFGNIDMNDIVEYMKLNLLNNVRLQIQMHKIIWHPDAIGV